LRYSGDHFAVNWYPANFSIIEQGEQANRQGEGQTMGATTCIDVGRYLPQKIAEIAAHRSQYAIEADMLPLPILQELMGREYFVRIPPAPEIETELLPASAAATQLSHS
jgi:hypothetical protein